MIRDRLDNEQRCIDMMDGLSGRFDLGWLRINHAFNVARDEERIACRTVCDFEYRQVSFVWYLAAVASMPDDELESVAIHELVHAMMAPLWNSLNERTQDKLHVMNELATENVTRMIEAVMRPGVPGAQQPQQPS
jgi:hypothetical protein